MGLFSRARDETAEERELRERSLEELRRGALPLRAQQRLSELRDSGAELFTSDLSVNEFALAHSSRITPLTQVMGSSFYKVGWRNLPSTYFSGWGGAQGYTAEMSSLSDAWNDARGRALGRLGAEAELAGADAVVGVRLNAGEHAWADAGSVEFTAVGTAVRLPEELRTASPVITDLSGQEYWQLALAGFRPVGVVGRTTVMYIASSWRQNLVAGGTWGTGWRNQELGEFTQGFYEARELALGHLNGQAAALGASGVVGVTLEQRHEEREYEGAGSGRRTDLIVTIHVLGTAIVEGHPVREQQPLTVLPLR